MEDSLGGNTLDLQYFEERGTKQVYRLTRSHWGRNSRQTLVFVMNEISSVISFKMNRVC